MNFLRFALFSTFCFLTACTSTPTSSPTSVALGMMQAAPPPPYAVMTGTPEANVPIETSFVTYFSYQFADDDGVRHTRHALIGPNEGDRDTAKATLDSNGELHIYSGFGYVSSFRSPTGGPGDDVEAKAAPQEVPPGIAATQPSMSRPYLRTRRVRMAGDGTAYAVQVTKDEDHCYYIHGVTFDAYSIDDPVKQKNWTQASKLKWFASIDDDDDFTGEATYASDAERKAFIDYLKKFTTPLGLIDP